MNDVQVLGRVGARLTSIQFWEGDQGRHPFKEPRAYKEQAVNEEIQTDLRRPSPAHRPLLLPNLLCFCMQILLVRIHLFNQSFLREWLHDQNSCIHIGLVLENIWNANAMETCCRCAGVYVRTWASTLSGQKAQFTPAAELWSHLQGPNSDMALCRSLIFQNNSSRIAWINYITESLVNNYSVWYMKMLHIAAAWFIKVNK